MNLVLDKWWRLLDIKSDWRYFLIFIRYFIYGKEIGAMNLTVGWTHIIITFFGLKRILVKLIVSRWIEGQSYAFICFYAAEELILKILKLKYE